METKDKFRNYLFKIYDSDIYLHRLEAKEDVGIRNGSIILPGKVLEEYVLHRQAAVFTFADYIYDNTKKKPDKKDKNCDIVKYILVDFKCYKKIEYCDKYNSDGTCKTCAINYILKFNKCFKKINNCEEYKKNG